MVTKLRIWIERVLTWQVKRLIKRHHPKIVAVTGSVGKTSTKSAIAQVLATEYRVQSDDESFNTPIGLPLAIFGHETPSWLVNPLAWLWILIQNEVQIWGPARYDAMVLEMGAERRGEIAHLLSYFQPDIGVVTAVKGVHMDSGQFSSLDEILAEKWQVASRSKLGVVNADDSRLLAKAPDLSPPAVTYGVDKGEYHWEELKLEPSGLQGKLIAGARSYTIQTPLIARHSLYAAIAAAAVADQLAIEPDNIIGALAGLKPVSGRMQPLPGKHGSFVIDDSYNSSPDTAIAALDSLYELPKTGRKIAILGSMNELGESSQAGHSQVGKHATKLDLLVTVGENARTHLAKSAAEAGLTQDKIRSFDNPYAAGEFVAANLKSGDQILVKGSQNGVFTEEAIKFLLANREDRKKLVRQSSSWLAKKKHAFEVK